MSEWSVVLTLRAWRLPRLAVRRGDVVAILSATNAAARGWNQQLARAECRIAVMQERLVQIKTIASKGDGK